MGNVWTVARHTIAESVRNKIAISFILLLVIILIGLPFASKGDNTISGAVQAFLSYSITAVTGLLSLLSILLAKILSDDISGKQILTLMTKPIPRWSYVVGRWLGIVCLNVALLTFAGGLIYGFTYYLASKPAMDELDAERLSGQILQARYASNAVVPSFAAAANAEYQENVEVGKYSGLENHDEKKEIERIKATKRERWRVVWPLEARLFEFEDVRCDRSPGKEIHLRYVHSVSRYPPDEIVKYKWYFGSPEKGTELYSVKRKDYIDRVHTVTFPAACVAADNTLQVIFENVNPYINEGDMQYDNTVIFKKEDALQVYFPIGTFGGNLTRTLSLVMFKLAFLAATAVAMTTVFSFPVACMGAFCVLLLANTQSFLLDSISWISQESGTTVLEYIMASIVRCVYFVIPDFAKYNALELLLDGRNVTLMWVLMGAGNLLLIKTTILLLAGCLLFMRREVDEVSL